MKRILAVVLSLCLLLCFPMTASAEEDPLTHFKGTGDYSDIRDYYDYLVQYLGDICGEPDPREWDETMCRRLSDEMSRIYNEYYNDIDHPYLRGTIDDETGEITITGMRYIGYATRFYYAQLGVMDEDADQFVEMRIQDLVIPDEIDGRPVTKIAASAFDVLLPDADTYERAHFSSVVIGDNVREIGSGAFKAQEAAITLGKNVETIGAGAFRATTVRRCRGVVPQGVEPD